MNKNFTYRSDIDGLRAFAVLAVVLFHAFPHQLRGGFVGVDVFFVISGFLISSILFKNLTLNKFSLIDFYARRIKRIFPALIIVLIFTLIVGWFALLPNDLVRLGKHVLAGTGFSSNLVLWGEAGYFDQSSEVKPLLHLWSLGIEEQFYLFWPIFLWLLWKNNQNPLSWIIFFGLGSFVLNILLIHNNPSTAFYLPLARFWELCIGSYLAWITIKNPQQLFSWGKKLNLNENQIKDWCSIMGLILLLSAFLFISQKLRFPGYWALLPTVGTFLLITAGPHAVINHHLLSRKIFVWFGLISYPLYLWHWPMFSYLNIIKFDATTTILITYKITLIFMSILLAWLSYRFVEIPIRKDHIGKIKVISLSFVMICISTLSYQIYRSDGFLNRYPVNVKNLITPIDFKFTDYARFGVCHFDTGSSSNNAAVGSSKCVEEKRPLVLLWGDSYAAALYPGLKALQKEHSFGIAQATECGTPPLSRLNIGDNTCRTSLQMNAWNHDVMNLIQTAHPEYLIMHAFWDGYSDQSWMLGELRKTISIVRSKSPQTHIIILGAVPQWGTWKDGLPLSMYRYWRTKSDFPPVYMRYGLAATAKEEDANFVAEIEKLGVTYISAYKVLCNSEGCLTRVGDKPTDLTAIDQGHLSKAGSEYLIRHIAKQIFNPAVNIVRN